MRLFLWLSMFHATANGLRSLADSSTTSLRSYTYRPSSRYSSRYAYPQIQTGSLAELYKGIDEKRIEDITITNDLSKIYYREVENKDSEEPVFHVATSNPIMVDRVIDYSEKHNVYTSFVDPPQGLFQSAGKLVETGLLLIYYPVMFLILFNILRSFFQGFGSGSGMNPFTGGSNPFDQQRNGKGMFSVGKPSRIDQTNMKNSNITLASWAGSKEVFEECFEIVRYLKNATAFKAVGAEIPKGVLLEGPPGTGKTLLAKAIASEADANFISVSASEFIELYVGLGAAKVRNLFTAARASKPSIIFIDEIDSIGRQRGAGINMGNDEREQTLNQLLSEMDGFVSNEGVLVIAATNRRDVLDSALLRPGRFDRLINVPLPDRVSREAILGVHAKSKKMSEDVRYEYLAELTAGFSGAQLKNLINEAAIYAARDGNTTISQQNIEYALEKIVVGIIKTVDTRSPEARERVALHEIGHAFLAAYFSEYFELKKVSIQSTYSGAGGYTLFGEYPNIAEAGLYTKDLLIKRIVVALGGKAAENLFYGEDHVSVGAVEDLKQANSLAQRMVGSYGMGNELEVFVNQNLDQESNPFLGKTLATGGVKYSESTRELYDKEVMDIIRSAYQEAKTILSLNRDSIQKIMAELLSKTTLSGDDFKKMVMQNVSDVSK
jgi:cell division protease FtsH